MVFRVRLIGSVAIETDGTMPNLGGPKQQAVLTVLALECGRAVSTSRLIDLVWDDRPPRSARRTLQSYVSSLRSTLGDSERLERVGDRYVLHIGREDVDLLSFEDEAVAALELAQADPHAAVVALADVDRRWEDPLGGLKISDGLQSLLAPFIELRLQVLEGLVTAQVDSGDAGDAVRTLDELVRQHPTREAFWLQFARGLGSLGRRDMALQALQRAREALREQLGVDPAPQLADLESELLSGMELGNLPTMPRAKKAPRSNLPVSPTRLIGRAAEVAAVGRMLTEHRLVTIADVGGSGKTRVAIAVGEREQRHRPDGVWFVNLAAARGVDQVLPAVAAAVGLQLTTRDTTAHLLDYLAEKQALIILDNCEHVVDACAQFAHAFLTASGDAVLLATSRQALDVEGEAVMRLGPLAVSSDENVHPPAVELFIERAKSIRPEFEGDADTIAALCGRLDGLPLAVELAAARMTVMTPDELLARLDERFTLLASGRRRRGQPTLAATLDWSYDLLDVEVQRVFRALGVFVNGFDVDAVGAVADVSRSAALDVIEALTAKSLVHRVDGGTVSRFGLLETLKVYSESRLAEGDETGLARDRHARHFHAIATTRGRTMLSDARLGKRLRFDTANITEAFDWLARNGQWTMAGELLVGSLAAFENHGHAAQARMLFERCEVPLEAIDCDLTNHLRSSILLSMIVVDDVAALDATARRLRSSDDPRSRVIGCSVLAFAARVSAPHEAQRLRDEAARHLEDANVQHPGLNSDLAFGMLQYEAGVALGLSGDVSGALAAYDRIPSALARHDYTSAALNTARSPAAICSVLLGEPTAAAERLAPLSDVGFAYGELHEVHALICFETGDADTARDHVRAHADEAATGWLSRQCNDSVLLLAQLGYVEGDHVIAQGLLGRMGIGRSPGTIMYARDLARRLGVADEHAERERTWAAPSSWAEHGVHGAGTAMIALTTERARRGWV